MMQVIDKAYNQSRAFIKQISNSAIQIKDTAGFDLTPLGGGFDNFRQKQSSRENYSLFIGWLYSAINAIALEAASQPVRQRRLRRQPQ